MRITTLAQAALLLTLPACEPGDDDMKLTGVCLYAADDPLVAACMNQWAGDSSCAMVGAQTGVHQAGDACSARGYARPCTHDHPQSLWVAEGNEQAACDAWLAEQEAP